MEHVSDGRVSPRFRDPFAVVDASRYRRATPDLMDWSALERVARRYGEAMRNLAKDRSVVKDPRFCWTLGAWLAGDVPVEAVVLAIRPLEAMADSRVKAGMYSPRARDWARHNYCYGLGLLMTTATQYRLPLTTLRFPTSSSNPTSSTTCCRCPPPGPARSFSTPSRRCSIPHSSTTTADPCPMTAPWHRSVRARAVGAGHGTPPRGVLVLGMHRSGLSAAAGLVTSLGLATCALGDMVRGPWNPSGHFESRSLMHLNDALLAQMGLRWGDPPPVGAAYAQVAARITTTPRQARRVSGASPHSPGLEGPPHLGAHSVLATCARRGMWRPWSCSATPSKWPRRCNAVTAFPCPSAWRCGSATTVSSSPTARGCLFSSPATQTSSSIPPGGRRAPWLSRGLGMRVALPPDTATQARDFIDPELRHSTHSRTDLIGVGAGRWPCTTPSRPQSVRARRWSPRNCRPRRPTSPRARRRGPRAELAWPPLGDRRARPAAGRHRGEDLTAGRPDGDLPSANSAPLPAQTQQKRTDSGRVVLSATSLMLKGKSRWKHAGQLSIVMMTRTTDLLYG